VKEIQQLVEIIKRGNCGANHMDRILLCYDCPLDPESIYSVVPNCMQHSLKMAKKELEKYSKEEICEALL